MLRATCNRADLTARRSFFLQKQTFAYAAEHDAHPSQSMNLPRRQNLSILRSCATLVGSVFFSLAPVRGEEAAEPSQSPDGQSGWGAWMERGKAAAESLQKIAEEARPVGESLLQQAQELREQADAIMQEHAEPWRAFLLSSPDDEAEVDAAPPPNSGEKPDCFSLRPDYQRLGLDVKHQGRRGSCTIFGTLGVIEFHYARRGQNLRLSEQFAGWAAAKASGNSQKLESYSSRALIQGIKAHGVCTEDLMPYDARRTGRPSPEALADAATRRSISETIFQRYRENRREKGFTEQTLNAICWSIYEGHPVTAAVGWPDTVRLDEGGNIEWKRRTPPPSGHMVVFVGYEIDDRWPGGGRMEIRNSWGENWGLDGYAYVDFDYLKKYGKEAFAIKAF